METSCKDCREPVDRKEAFEVDGGLVCSSCFVKRAQKRKGVSGEDLKKLKRAVKEELSGLLPREALKDLIEEGYRRILIKQEDLDGVSAWLVNEIERMAGLAVCRRVLDYMRGMADAVAKGLESEEAEVREQIRRLGDLGIR